MNLCDQRSMLTVVSVFSKKTLFCNKRYSKIFIVIYFSLFINALSAQDHYQYDELGRLKADLKEGIVRIDWNNQNKITHIIKADTCHTPDVIYTYNSAGLRLTKTIIPRDGTKRRPEYEWRTIYYEYDTHGNVITTYATDCKKIDNQSFKNSFGDARYFFYSDHYKGSFAQQTTLCELSFQAQVNGEGRFSNKQLIGILLPAWQEPHASRGEKKLEMQDYLNNIFSIVSDRKAQDGTNVKAGVVMSKNYYPFGMTMQTDHMQKDYRSIGYGGKETDDEIKGLDNSYDFDARMYDPRLGRWLSIDPLQSRYASYSPYNYVLNSPMILKDPDGRKVTDSKGNEVTLLPSQNKNGSWNVEFQFEEGVLKSDQAKFRNSEAAKLLHKAAQNSAGRELLNKLNKTSVAIEIRFAKTDDNRSFSWEMYEWPNGDLKVKLTINTPLLEKRLTQTRSLLNKLARVEKKIEKNLTTDKYDALVAEKESITRELLEARLAMTRKMSVEEYTSLVKLSDQEFLSITAFSILDLLSNPREWVVYQKYLTSFEDAGKITESNFAYFSMILKLDERFKTYHEAYLKEKQRKKR